MVTVVGEDHKHIRECSCRKCAAKLQYTQSEVQKGKHYDYGGGCDDVYWIICPKCGAEVTVRGY